jgi:hypothetical protein
MKNESPSIQSAEEESHAFTFVAANRALVDGHPKLHTTNQPHALDADRDEENQPEEEDADKIHTCIPLLRSCLGG